MARQFSSGDYYNIGLMTRGLGVHWAQLGTVSFWFKTTNNVNNQGIWMCADSGASVNGIVIYLTSTAVNISVKNGGGLNGVGMTGTPYDGKWHHVAFCWNQVNGGSQIIYLDGVSNSGAVNGNWSYGWDDIRIGRVQDGFWASYVGTMAEHCVWSGVQLSAAEIKALSQGIKPGRIRDKLIWTYQPLLGVPGTIEKDSGPLRLDIIQNGTLASANHPPILSTSNDGGARDVAWTGAVQTVEAPARQTTFRHNDGPKNTHSQVPAPAQKRNSSPSSYYRAPVNGVGNIGFSPGGAAVTTVTSVSGSVQIQGIAQSGLLVRLYDRRTGQFLGYTYTNNSGNFTIPAQGRTSVDIVSYNDFTYDALIYTRVTPV